MKTPPPPGGASAGAILRVSPERLRHWLGQFIGERHHRTSPAALARAAALVRETFAGTGWSVLEQEVRGPHGTGANIIARRVGAGAPDRTWIVGAHYDTVPGTPGADDNGLAVAGLLEIATLLADQALDDTVELVAWDMEEWQTLSAGSKIGSGVMADAARREGRRLQGVIALEMIGCCRHEPGSQRLPMGFGLLLGDHAHQIQARQMRGDFLAAVGNARAESVLAALGTAAARTGLPLLPLTVSGAAGLVPHFYRSDHAPFWRAGYAGVMLTDTSEFRNPHYHAASDSMETIDFGFGARVIETVIDALRALAGARQ